jgi:hypothetical protein
VSSVAKGVTDTFPSRVDKNVYFTKTVTINTLAVLNGSATTLPTHNLTKGLQGGNGSNYYHSNQAINTTSNVVFNGVSVNGTITANYFSGLNSSPNYSYTSGTANYAALSNTANYVINGGSATTSSHNFLLDIQGGVSPNYYHSNQFINTTSNVTFNAIVVSNTVTANKLVGNGAGVTSVSASSVTGLRLSPSIVVGGALVNLSTGVGNIAIGDNSNLQQTSSGGYNIAVGYSAGANITGANNTLIGYGSMISSTGAGNVAIGYKSGYYETLDNKLYIDNQDRTNEAGNRTKALIYGQFAAATANQFVNINGGLSVAGNVTSNRFVGDGTSLTGIQLSSTTLNAVINGSVTLNNVVVLSKVIGQLSTTYNAIQFVPSQAYSTYNIGYISIATQNCTVSTTNGTIIVNQTGWYKLTLQGALQKENGLDDIEGGISVISGSDPIEYGEFRLDDNVSGYNSFSVSFLYKVNTVPVTFSFRLKNITSNTRYVILRSLSFFTMSI